MMNEFTQGLLSAIKETPKGFFAPAIAIWRLLFSVTESVLHRNQHKAT